MLLTAPGGGQYNRVLSTDATINLTNGYRLSSQFVGSGASAGKFKSAYSVGLSKQAQLYNYNMSFVNIDPGFRDNVNPVGFIQVDDRKAAYAFGGNEMWIRKHGIDKINTYLNGNLIWSHSNNLRNAKLEGWVGVTFFDKWLFGIAKSYHSELFEKRFRNNTTTWEMGYNLQSWNNWSLFHVWGRNFDADFHRFRARIHLKPSSRVSVSYEFTHLTLEPDPDNSSTDLHFVTTDYNFTPDIWLRLISQYSTRNERIYAYCLLGWRFSPPFGALYLAYTADRLDREDELLLVPVRERLRTFFVKLTVPLDVF